jgi:hypothetical protein
MSKTNRPWVMMNCCSAADLRRLRSNLRWQVFWCPSFNEGTEFETGRPGKVAICRNRKGGKWRSYAESSRCHECPDEPEHRLHSRCCRSHIAEDSITACRRSDLLAPIGRFTETRQHVRLPQNLRPLLLSVVYNRENMKAWLKIGP